MPLLVPMYTPTPKHTYSIAYHHKYIKIRECIIMYIRNIFACIYIFALMLGGCMECGQVYFSLDIYLISWYDVCDFTS